MFRSCVPKAITSSRCFARMYSKDVRFGSGVRAMMIRGVDILADAVAVTMGPKGRSVIVERPWTSPKITKDGFTVARSIALKDQHMNLGAKLVQDVADNTNESAGDGTTTATVLARAIAKEGFNQITMGANPVEIRRGVMLAVDVVKDKLKEMSKAVETREEIQQVATLSANGDTEIGRLIGEATDKVGPRGTITVKDGNRLKDELNIIQGLRFDNGYVSPFFVNSSKGSKVEFANALVMISLKKITGLSQIVKGLEQSLRQRRPLIIIAEDISGEALNALVLNKLRLGLQVCAVKSPSYGHHRKELIGDISAATGATIFGDDINYSKMEEAKLEDLGQVGEAVISKDSTMLLQGKPKTGLLEMRIQQIQDELAEKQIKPEQRDRLRQRLSALTKGVAVLHIGGGSEVEVNEKKDRVVDALNATRAAIEEGIVPGGGTAFLRCIPYLQELKTESADLQKGVDIVCNALRMPCQTIAQNAGVDGPMVVAKVLNGSEDYGYDAMGDEYCRLVEKGIIDPTKVLRTAITDAAGVASLLSTTEVVITDSRNDDLLSKLSGAGGGMDDGLDMNMGGLEELAALSGLGGMGGMGGMGGGFGGMGAGGGMSASASNDGPTAEEMNEMVKAIPGMEQVEVRDIDSGMM
nr:GH05807p [Drosophila melanogaster]